MIYKMLFLTLSLVIFGFNKCPAQNPQKDNMTVVQAVHNTGMVQSEDGTQIGYHKVGSGPIHLVIVHGAFNSSEQWLPVAKALAKDCTCYVMDRRGRPLSGDFGANYTLEKEVEDIKAVLDAAGPGAYLLGHSSGAIYALEAARHYDVAGLILYEPPLHYQHFKESIWPRLVEKDRKKNFEELTAVFFKSEIGLPNDELTALQATPLWKQMVALTPTFVPEWTAGFRAGPKVEWYRNISAPTLLLAGTITEDHPSMAIKDLESLLPNVQKVMLKGYGHVANLAAPDLVAKVVADFLVSTSH